MSSNVFTLDSLREEADKEFAPFKIPLSDGTYVVLRNLLRLNQKTRETVLEAVESLNSKDDDKEQSSFEAVAEMVATATKIIDLISDANGKKLVKEIDGDIALLIQIIKSWMSETQLGEADSSPTSSTDTASTSSPISNTDTE